MTPAPRTFRDVLDLFRFYHDDIGLDALLDTVDLDGVHPRQIYYAVHGRPPDTIDEATSEQQYPIAAILGAALRSDEFRQNFVRFALAAFPDKRRMLFIHIPKSAGSNLSSHLVSQFASFNTNFAIPGLAADERFFGLVKSFSLELRGCDEVYIHGHNHLDTYEQWGALRHGDRIFTVLRRPAELILSQINYVLTRMASDEVPIPADTAGWRQEFGFAPGGVLAKADAIALGARILAHPGVVPANVMTRYLGAGTADTAAERIVTRDIEVTTMPHYDAWCRERWGIQHQTRRNASERFLAWDDLTPQQRATIADSNQEDLRLYDWVNRRLDTAGASHLTGRQFLPVDFTPTSPPLPAPAIIGGKPEAPGSAELMLRFESLGENCEFGLVQRRCGAEPLGLLRWASAPYDKLLRAVQAGFAGLGEPDTMRVELSGNGREYMVQDLCYGFYSHAWVLKDEATPEQVLAREARRIPFLRRKLLEDFALAEKIFVYHGMSPLTEQQAWDLSGALRVYGPATLFWVELAEPAHPNGTVQQLGEGLARGYIDRFAPGHDAHDTSLASWTSLCATACSVLGDRHCRSMRQRPG